VLVRVPDAKLAWKPHRKARTLGELAMHVAMPPGAVAEFVVDSPVQAPDFTDPPEERGGAPSDAGRERRDGKTPTRMNG
jgi:hypothetical protein